MLCARSHSFEYSFSEFVPFRYHPVANILCPKGATHISEIRQMARDGTEISPIPPLKEERGLLRMRPYLNVNVYVCFVSPSGPVTSIVAAAWVETVTGQRLDAGLPFTVIPLIRLDMATGVNVTWLPPAFTS